MTYTSPLYRPQFEHDACGIGAVVDIKGRRSYGTVDNALEIVEKLEHRAGKDAAGETGDGVGILLQIPHRLLSRWAEEQGLSLGEERDYGVGMFFFPQDKLKRAQAKKMLEIIVDKEGMDFLGWRDVPVHPEVLGQKALDCMPRICQCFVKRPADCPRGLDFDRKLYVVRRTFEQSNVNTYIPSFSSRTIVYKGMFLVGQLRQFYADLTDPDCESAIALVHSRFSTNTTPSWERAHPNRYILHNGEINTIRGNVDRMLAREETISSPLMDDDMDKILPVVDQRGSDSAMLDNTLEFLMMNGVELPQAVMMCIPEPWANDKRMDREKRDFYHYYATMMEPWDGPAAIVFSDGDAVGAVLDRNGLRPCRWYLTDDEQLILSSEVGVLDIPPEKIVKKSRLQPGRMLLADLRQGRLVDDSEIKQSYAVRQPYGEWLDSHLVHLRELPIPNRRVETHSQALRDRLYKAFGYTYEEVKDAVLPMARDGMEPTSAMGVDTPLITSVTNGSPAQEAGIKEGDVIVKMNRKPIHFFREVSMYGMFYEGDPVKITYERDGQRHAAELTPAYDEKTGRYVLGLGSQSTLARKKGNVLSNLKYGVYEIKYWIWTTLQSLKMLGTGKVSPNEMSGPVGIVKTIGDTYEASRSDGYFYVFLNMLNFSILLSANLGVMNLLPLPALDGGRLVFLLLEAVRRKKVNPEKEGMVHFVGIVILMGIMVLVMFNDIRKLFI